MDEGEQLKKQFYILNLLSAHPHKGNFKCPVWQKYQSIFSLITALKKPPIWFVCTLLRS